MKKHTYIKSLASLGALLSLGLSLILGLAPALVSAADISTQTNTNNQVNNGSVTNQVNGAANVQTQNSNTKTETKVNAKVNTNAVMNAAERANKIASSTAAKVTTRIMNAKERADSDIQNRVDSLAKVTARIQAMKNVTDAEKAEFNAEIQAQVSSLNALKVTIDGESGTTTLKTDIKSIFGSYRIYALFIPKGYILSAADRINHISDLMTTLSAKLQVNITTLQTGGVNVTSATTAITDLNAKVADARIQATAATNAVASLTPDQGDKTKLAANNAALAHAKADIRVGEQDLMKARQDIEVINKFLRANHVSTSTTVNATTTTP